MATKSEELKVLLKVNSDEKATTENPVPHKISSDVVEHIELSLISDEKGTIEQSVSKMTDSVVLEKIDSNSDKVEMICVKTPLSQLSSSDTLQKTSLTSDKANETVVDIALTQMNFTPAAKQLLLDPKGATTNLDSLQSIALTQEHLVQVKKSLGHIIDSLHDNPSIVSRAAQYWGELPLWQRILGGVVISGPTLVIGAAAHIGFLLTISGVSVLAYTTSGIILDDHHVHTKSIAEKLKQGIFGIAEVLELTIAALDNIRQKLALEVKKFQEENEKLAKNITRLNEEVETLSAQVELFIATEKLLRERKDELEKMSHTLKQDFEKQKQQSDANQKEVEQLKELHKKSLEQLDIKIEELAKVRKSLSTELDKARLTASTLEGTVKILSTTAISDTTQRQNFQERLSSFLNDKSTNFDQIADRMSKAEQELVQVKSDLQASNIRYKEMLAYQELLIKRLEKLDKSMDSSARSNEESTPPPKEKELTKTGGVLGFFTLPQIWSSTPANPPPNTPDIKSPVLH